MAKNLVVVESPAKAKTIAKFLGKNYVVKASMGHIRDLPKSQLGVDIENDFSPKYITIRGKGDILKELKGAAKKVNKILLATDPDREGEAIAWHLQHILNVEENQACRIEFNEITEQAIKSAVKAPRKIDLARVEAQQARRVLDRLVGYKLSPLLWRKIRKGLSAGRVQSVAVRLISEREEEINDFIPQEYWSLEAEFTNKSNKKLKTKLHKIKGDKTEIASTQEMDKYLAQIELNKYQVQEVRKREKRRNPSPPFTTSSLQQEAYRKLGFAAKKTMMLAQQLYEGLDLGKEGTVGLLTYIRTDSTRISEVAQEEARDYIIDNFGVDYYPPEPRQYLAKKRAQEAHEAIRPTSVIRHPDAIKSYVARDQYRLYKLVYDRFLASQMASAVLDTTSVDIVGGEFLFRAVGSIMKFPGFMKVYIDAEEEADKDKELLEVKEGETLKLGALKPEQHFTQPPARYTDASLIKALEELGIGRPSTFAPTVETIQKRAYVVKEEKQFFPTELGILVVDMLVEHFPQIIDVEFTALLEDRLDQIEEGILGWQDVLTEFFEPFQDSLEKAEALIGEVKLEDPVSDELCPECGRNLVIKFGRFGKFLACPGFPECRFTKPLLESTGIRCPKCEEGEIVGRRSKKGRKFYGCNRYPECDFVTWDMPTDKKCPECEELLVKKISKSKGDYLRCSKKGCNYQELLMAEGE